MKVNIIGLGYTGQTLATVMADVGFTVYGTDVNDKVLDLLKNGKSHILEKNLELLIRKYIGKNLFVGRPEEINSDNVDAYIVCVHTPIDQDTKEPILDAVKSAFIGIKNKLKKGQLVILRSTVPLGTTRNYVKPILEESGL